MRSAIYLAIYLGLLTAMVAPASAGQKGALQFQLRYQEPIAEGADRYHRRTRQEKWQPEHSALIICDVWDSHSSVNAVRRVGELAPRIDRLANELRRNGATIIHAPSSCMEAYHTHPARQRARNISPAASVPPDISSWCHSLPSEEVAAYPLDQSDGGNEDDPADHEQWIARLVDAGCNPQAPWKKQSAAIEIDPQRDYISDSGTEIWSILEQQQIDNVILVGVHTNMCVLGRPFGLRRLSQAGKNVVLCRDLTDTMYNPARWPYANHFTGTDLIVSHIERHVCPTISSEQVLEDVQPFRFRHDRRMRLAMIIAEDEYETERTLPQFAEKHLSQHFSVSIVYGDESNRHALVGTEQLKQADALLISVRRRALPETDLQAIEQFVSSGKPLIGIRTASHAFSLRNQQADDGLAVWPEFDAEAWGGNYHDHYGNSLSSRLQLAEPIKRHPILQASPGIEAIQPGGSLYKTSPLLPGTRVLLTGTVKGQPAEPVAWTFIRTDGGRSFYTSLGHRKDFEKPQFKALLSAGIHWACGRQPHSLDRVREQDQRFDAGKGKQR